MNLNSILIAQTEAENKAKIDEISEKYKISKRDKSELMNMMDEAYKNWNREQIDNHRFSAFLHGILGTDYIYVMNLYYKLRQMQYCTEKQMKDFSDILF